MTPIADFVNTVNHVSALVHTAPRDQCVGEVAATGTAAEVFVNGLQQQEEDGGSHTAGLTAGHTSQVSQKPTEINRRIETELGTGK